MSTEERSRTTVSATHIRGFTLRRRQRARRILSHAAAILAAVALVSCAAKIKRFTVIPHEVCPGTPVKVDWKVRGGPAAIATDPPLNPQADRTYLPGATTRFILTVTPRIGKPKSAETAVTVYVGAPDHPALSEIGLNTKCETGQLVATAKRPFSEWDSNLRVGLVSSDEGRDVTVHHEGRQATLTAQEPQTNAFDGTRLGGNWAVTVPTLPSETCESAGVRPPDLIILTADVRCGS
jgi:hypothetical protein